MALLHLAGAAAPNIGNAMKRLRFAHIELFDPAVGNRAAQRFGPQHVGQDHISGIDRFARDFFTAFGSRRRDADHSPSCAFYHRE